jgi:hypothetical protein
MNAAAIAATLGDARREGRAWRCRCPLHGGRSRVRIAMPPQPGADFNDVLAGRVASKINETRHVTA